MWALSEPAAKMSDSEMLPSSLTPTLPETLPSESLTRRSARIQGRRPKKDSFANLEYKVNRKWKDCEKILLARAVRRNGSRNIGVISEKIRTRSESEVRTFMDKERTKQVCAFFWFMLQLEVCSGDKLNFRNSNP